MITITNTTGANVETKVTLEDGTPIHGISKIVIESIDANDKTNERLQATVTITNVKLNLSVDNENVALEQENHEP